MSNLYLDRKNLSVKLDGQALVLYEDGARKGSVPLNLLERVVMHGNVLLESRVLGALSERNISLLLLSGRYSEATAMLVGRSHNDSMRRIGQYRLVEDSELRKELAFQLICHKLRAQRRFLHDALLQRPDLRYPLSTSNETLMTILNTLAQLSELPDSDQLQGYEGAGAAAFFSGYRHLFPDALKFTGRKKRPPPDPVNVCLSLGYTLLHYDAVRALHQVGLDPMLGFFHELHFGRESLACDLIEPLRPLVDRWVWQLFRDRQLTMDHFSFENERCLLGKAGRQIFYGCYEAEARAVRRLLRLNGYRLARRCLEIYQQSVGLL